MSWSMSRAAGHDEIERETIADLLQFGDEHVLGSPQTSPEGVESAQADHIAYAVEAAKVLAAAIGRPGDRVKVIMSGHANPDHAPYPGWSNEFITITVYACPPRE